ncbi:uncharacterized protein VTP21DRAFT_8758 [Calcarisporiella thermophila]|uniref:uncharacterized protein n=1 Tax=Calcarisporiella thermophila TaxID=911321 RepID=UPI003743CE0C
MPDPVPTHILLLLAALSACLLTSLTRLLVDAAPFSSPAFSHPGADPRLWLQHRSRGEHAMLRQLLAWNPDLSRDEEHVLGEVRRLFEERRDVLAGVLAEH